MKTKSRVRRAPAKAAPRSIRKPAPRRRLPVVYLHRTGPAEFSCGFDETRVLTVEESLDERERRG